MQGYLSIERAPTLSILNDLADVGEARRDQTFTMRGHVAVKSSGDPYTFEVELMHLGLSPPRFGRVVRLEVNDRSVFKDDACVIFGTRIFRRGRNVAGNLNRFVVAYDDGVFALLFRNVTSFYDNGSLRSSVLAHGQSLPLRS
jgi:hypothetical protein